MRRAAPLILAAFFAAVPCRAELPPVKAAPTRPPSGPSIVVEEFEILPDCAAEKVCAEGLIRNTGSKTAYGVRLRIDIGGTKYGKPRTSLFRDVDKSEMESTEAQSVSFTVDRKLPYKNEKGEDKVLEVGRFNIKVVPVWRDTAKPPPKKTAPKPAPRKK
jgi:hypothetical protein